MKFIALSPVIILVISTLHFIIAIVARLWSPYIENCLTGAFIWSLIAFFFVSRDFGRGKVIIND